MYAGRRNYSDPDHMPPVDESRLLIGMAAAFAGMTVLMGMVGIVYNPVVLVVAAMFGVVTYVLWTHGTGRLASRLYERVQRQAASGARRGRAERGGFGAGPREEWRPPRDRRQGRQVNQGRQRRRTGDRAPRTTDGPTATEAYRTLGLEPGADEQSIRQAYRRKVKAAHPDTEGGDEQQFKDVQSAYERLTDQ